MNLKSALLQNRTRQVVLLTLVSMACLTAVAVHVKRVLDSRVNQANTSAVRLELPATITTNVNQDFDVTANFINPGNLVRGVDTLLNYDHTVLQLLSITPNLDSNFKTFAPVIVSSGQFDSTTVISKANQTGKIEFGAVTFDWLNQSVTPQVSTNTLLATLRFKPLKAGSTNINFELSPGVSTTDTNVVLDANPPQDLLLSSSQLTNSAILINSIIATPTSSPVNPPVSSPVSSPAGSDLIVNGGFETGNVSGWNTSGTNAVVINTDRHSGAYGVRLSNKDSYVSQNLRPKLVAGVAYNISAWVKVTKFSPTSWAAPRLRISKYVDLGTDEYGQSIGVNSTSLGWQKLALTKTFSASELSGAANIYIGVKNFGMANSVVVIDDISVLAPGSTNPPPLVSTPTPSPVPTRSPSPAPTRSPSPTPVSAPSPTPVSTANIIINGDFEASTTITNWNLGGTATITTAAYEGARAARFLYSDSYASQNIKSKVAAGIPYKITAWYKVIAPTSGTWSWGVPMLRISQYGDLGTGDYGQANGSAAVSSSWQKLEFTKTFTVSELSIANLYFGFKMFGHNGEVYVDSITFTPQ